MITLPRPEVILTHESDLDGLVSGLLLKKLAEKLFGDDTRLEAFHNHNWRNRAAAESSAWVCDMSFERRLDKTGWVIIDHHPTEAPARNAILIHDPTKSASLLCYELCQAQGLATPELDRLVHLSNVADLFLENDPDFMAATDHANLVKSYGFWTVHKLIEGRIEKLVGHPLLEVMAVKRRVEDPLGLEWCRKNITEISPEIGLVHSIIGNTNLIIHKLLAEGSTPFPVLMTLFRRPNGTILVSLRSRNGEAVKIAAQLQGGGHPNACGATIPKSIQQIPDAVDYLRKILNPLSTRGTGLNSLASVLDGVSAR